MQEKSLPKVVAETVEGVQRVFLQVLPGALVVVVVSEHSVKISDHDGDGRDSWRHRRLAR